MSFGTFAIAFATAFLAASFIREWRRRGRK